MSDDSSNSDSIKLYKVEYHVKDSDYIFANSESEAVEYMKNLVEMYFGEKVSDVHVSATHLPITSIKEILPEDINITTQVGNFYFKLGYNNINKVVKQIIEDLSSQSENSIQCARRLRPISKIGNSDNDPNEEQQ